MTTRPPTPPRANTDGTDRDRADATDGLQTTRADAADGAVPDRADATDGIQTTRADATDATDGSHGIGSADGTDATGITPPAEATPPPALLAEVHRDLAALAHARRRRLALFTALALALITASAYAMGHTPHGFTGPGCGHGAHALILTALGGLGLGLVALAFGASLPAGRRLRALPPTAAAAALLALALLAALYPTPAGPFLHGIKCLATGAALAFLLVTLTVLLGHRVLRRHAPTATLFGVGVGLLALLPLSLACPDGSMAHLMLWHGAIPLAGGLIAALAWRPR